MNFSESETNNMKIRFPDLAQAIPATSPSAQDDSFDKMGKLKKLGELFVLPHGMARLICGKSSPHEISYGLQSHEAKKSTRLRLRRVEKTNPIMK